MFGVLCLTNFGGNSPKTFTDIHRKVLGRVSRGMFRRFSGKKYGGIFWRIFAGISAFLKKFSNKSSDKFINLCLWGNSSSSSLKEGGIYRKISGGFPRRNLWVISEGILGNKSPKNIPKDEYISGEFFGKKYRERKISGVIHREISERTVGRILRIFLEKSLETYSVLYITVEFLNKVSKDFLEEFLYERLKEILGQILKFLWVSCENFGSNFQSSQWMNPGEIFKRIL